MVEVGRMRLLRAGTRAALNAATQWLVRAPRPTPVDVLVVDSTASHVQRLEPILARLRAAGLSTGSVQLDYRRRLVGWEFAAPRAELPLATDRHHAAHAAYLVQRYRPKLVLGSLELMRLPSYLRRELAVSGSKLVNVPHCPPDPDLGYSMFDFDYYFVFGPHAAATCRAMPRRVGATTLVQTGSPYIGADLAPLPLPPDPAQVLFVAQRSPYLPPRPREQILATEALVIAWAQARPEVQLAIKPHYSDDSDAIPLAAGEAPNIRVLPPRSSLRDALAAAHTVITMHSAAALEAALLGRPIVLAGPAGVPDEQLELPRFFGARSPDFAGIDEGLARVRADPGAAVAQCRAFVAHHLAHTTDAQAVVADTLAAIARGEEVVGEALPATIGLDGEPLDVP